MWHKLQTFFISMYGIRFESKIVGNQLIVYRHAINISIMLCFKLFFHEAMYELIVKPTMFAYLPDQNPKKHTEVVDL